MIFEANVFCFSSSPLKDATIRTFWGFSFFFSFSLNILNTQFFSVPRSVCKSHSVCNKLAVREYIH